MTRKVRGSLGLAVLSLLLILSACHRKKKRAPLFLSDSTPQGQTSSGGAEAPPPPWTPPPDPQLQKTVAAVIDSEGNSIVLGREQNTAGWLILKMTRLGAFSGFTAAGTTEELSNFRLEYDLQGAIRVTPLAGAEIDLVDLAWDEDWKRLFVLMTEKKEAITRAVLLAVHSDTGLPLTNWGNGDRNTNVWGVPWGIARRGYSLVHDWYYETPSGQARSDTISGTRMTVDALHRPWIVGPWTAGGIMHIGAARFLVNGEEDTNFRGRPSSYLVWPLPGHETDEVVINDVACTQAGNGQKAYVLGTVGYHSLANGSPGKAAFILALDDDGSFNMNFLDNVFLDFGDGWAGEDSSGNVVAGETTQSNRQTFREWNIPGGRLRLDRIEFFNTVVGFVWFRFTTGATWSPTEGMKLHVDPIGGDVYVAFGESESGLGFWALGRIDAWGRNLQAGMFYQGVGVSVRPTDMTTAPGRVLVGCTLVSPGASTGDVFEVDQSGLRLVPGFGNNGQLTLAGSEGPFLRTLFDGKVLSMFHTPEGFDREEFDP